MKNMQDILEIFLTSMYGGYTPDQQSIIDSVLEYAKTLIGTPYRWHKEGDSIQGNDKFWATNAQHITREQINTTNKCIVCTGLINLMRRFLKLSIPGADGNGPDDYRTFPGTTGTWFHYLSEKGRLESLDITRKYPKGTLLLRDFGSVDKDQGHVAVLIDELGSTIFDQTIIHAYSEHGYAESIAEGRVNVGQTGLTNFKVSHYWGQEEKEPGYYTHICLPENWLLQD